MIACNQALDAIENIHTYPIDKSRGADNFDIQTWREGLADAAVEAIGNSRSKPYKISGPYEAVVRMRDGEDVAAKISRRWGFKREGAAILLNAGELRMIYLQLIGLCYLNPFILKILPLALFLSNLKGRIGLAWVRRRIRGRKGGIKRGQAGC